MPRRAWAYIWFIFITGMIVVLLAGLDFSVTGSLSEQWPILVALTIFATLAQLFKAEAPDHQIYHTTLVFQFAGVVLLHPALFAFLIIIPHLAEWVRERLFVENSRHLRDWYLQPFNIFLHIIVGALTHIVYFSLSNVLVEFGNVAALITAVTAAAIYVILNHLLVGLAIVFARGVSLRESGIMAASSLVADLVSLLMGYAVSVFWQINLWLVWIALAPLIVIYRALSIPNLERQAQMDAKTAVWNAGYFKTALQTELNRAQSLRRPLTLVMADLDYLRRVNNTYGHLAGDAVLQGVARILRESAHDFDIVSRFGGEEFAILMPETTAEQALERIEIMRNAIAAAEFTSTVHDEIIKVTMSFGIAARKGDSQSAADIVHCADIAVYQAKENGRNRSYIYDYKRDRNLKLPNAASELPETPTNTAKPLLPTISIPNHAVPAPPGKTAAPEKQASEITSPQMSPQVKTYIVSVAIFAATLIMLSYPFDLAPDWTGLLAFVGLVLLVEALSVEIHVRDSTVSTSVAPYMAAILLFGPIAAVIIAPIIALVNLIKRRGPFSRALFNTGNHAITGLLCAEFILFSGRAITTWPIMVQIMVSLATISFAYFVTTGLLAVAISLDSDQPLSRVWTERFRWLAPYYLALGFVVYALIFSYVSAGILGILVVLVPLLMLRFSQKQYVDHTEELVQQLRANNQELRIQSEEITLLNEELLLTLARSIDLRDPYVMEHAKNVARYAVLTAQELGLSPERIEHIRKAGLLHDIGKLGIPEVVLFKPSDLTDDEYELIKEHVNIGAELIYGCHSLHNLIPFVQHHHERFDGKGYPSQISGEEIPLEARILNLADAVEAMASDRPYKLAESPEEILEEVTRCAGGQFDPNVVEAFRRVVDKYGYSVIVNSARNVQAGAYASVKTLSQEPHR